MTIPARFLSRPVRPLDVFPGPRVRSIARARLPFKRVRLSCAKRSCPISLADPLPRRALVSLQGSKAEEVTWEDQQHICAFGRFNTRVHEVNAELRAKAVRARKQRLVLVSRRFV